MAVGAACGGDDGDDGDDAATPEPAGQATEEEAGAEDEEPAGGEDEAAAPSAAEDLCSLISPDDISGAAGVTVTESETGFGGGSYGEVEFDSRGCNYADEDGATEVKVHLLVEPEGGAESLFGSLQETSAGMDMFDEYPHEVLDGLGDGAFLAAGMRSRDLWVLSGDDVIYIKGEANDEQLETPALREVAELTISSTS